MEDLIPAMLQTRPLTLELMEMKFLALIHYLTFLSIPDLVPSALRARTAKI
ncbi:MAG: hypothetical protein AB8H03_07765 [Saprospiraceae bacterium]